MNTLPALLLRNAEERPGEVAMRRKFRGRWEETTWSAYAERVAAVAADLRELGIGPGDRVAVHSENRPEWVVTDLAVQGLGAQTVGIYPTSPATEVEYLLRHSGARVLVAEDEEQLDKVLAVRDGLPNLKQVVVIDPLGIRDLDDIRVYDDKPRERALAATTRLRWESIAPLGGPVVPDV